MITISDVIKYLEQLFPKQLAFDKDPIGLHVGNVNRTVTKVLVTLDVTEAVVKEALKQGANLIISHHPFIYRPLTTINTNTPKGKIIELVLKHDLTIYSMHTNYDIAPGGMNDCLAEALELTQIKPLILTKCENFSKIAIYVPTTHVEIVRNAMVKGGVGQIGNYSHCTFATQGTGTFKPLEGSQPYLGNTNELAQVEEVKLEGVLKSDHLNHMLELVKAVHPYEEIAYDYYALNGPNLGTQYGLGRIGQVSNSGLSAREYIDFVKTKLQVNHVRFIGNLDKKIRTVAIIGGSGSSYIAAVKTKKADLFITGDVGFHDGQDALDLGLNVLDVGHHVESMMKVHVAEILNNKMENIAIDSVISTDPFKFI